MKEFIHIGQRLVLLVLVWILSFIPISIFNSKSSCATGDIFVFAFWIGLFCGLYGIFFGDRGLFSVAEARARLCYSKYSNGYSTIVVTVRSISFAITNKLIRKSKYKTF